MNTYIAEFYTVTDKNNVVTQIGKMSILQPKITYNGKKTKWFDDTKLLKTSQSIGKENPVDVSESISERKEILEDQ